MGNKKKEQSLIPNRHVRKLSLTLINQGLKPNLRINLMPNAQSLIHLPCRLYCG